MAMNLACHPALPSRLPAHARQKQRSVGTRGKPPKAYPRFALFSSRSWFAGTTPTGRKTRLDYSQGLDDIAPTNSDSAPSQAAHQDTGHGYRHQPVRGTIARRPGEARGEGCSNGVKTMRWKALVVGLGLIGAAVAGCAKQCFVHECDWDHYANGMQTPSDLATNPSYSSIQVCKDIH